MTPHQRGPSSAGVAPAGYVFSTSASAVHTGRYSLWSEIVGPLSTKTYSTAVPPSTATYPDSAFTAGGSALKGGLLSVPVFPVRRPASG